MALQRPFAVIADQSARDVVEALRAAGAYPIIEARWADAAAVLKARPPQAVILADGCADRARAAVLEKALEVQAAQEAGLFTPVIARARDDAAQRFADALVIGAKTPPERLIGRLNAVLRVRNLHATVLRRLRTLAARSKQLPELSDADPLDEASVLVAGRGRSYPSLCTAAGGHVGVVGALTVEGAARALKAREIDGMIIGEGFGARVVEALLTVLAEEERFRDLPVAMVGNHAAVIETFAASLPNLERVGGGPQRAIDHLVPYLRLHAFARRFKRMLASLDARGAIDPDSGLLANAVFWRNLNRAIDDADKRGAALSIARFSLPAADRRMSLKGSAPRRPLDAPGRFCLPGDRQIDLHSVRRDRSARGACGDAADRQPTKEGHARHRRQSRPRARGDARNAEAARHDRLADRPHRRGAAQAGVNSPSARHGRACPGHPRLRDGRKDVDARNKCGHNDIAFLYRLQCEQPDRGPPHGCIE